MVVVRKHLTNTRFRVVSNKKRFLVLSNKFLETNSAAIRPVYSLFKTHLSALRKLRRGQSIPVGEYNIAKEWVGNYSGRNNKALFRVSSERGQFFVKFGVGGHSARKYFQGYSIAKRYLESIGNKVCGFNVGVIEPHVVYEPHKSKLWDHSTRKGTGVKSVSRESFDILVTDFVPPDCVLLCDLEQQMPEPIWNESPQNRAVVGLNNELTKRGLTDIDTHNIFFNQKTNSLLLFDFGFNAKLLAMQNLI